MIANDHEASYRVSDAYKHIARHIGFKCIRITQTIDKQTNLYNALDAHTNVCTARTNVCIVRTNMCIMRTNVCMTCTNAW